MGAPHCFVVRGSREAGPPPLGTFVLTPERSSCSSRARCGGRRPSSAALPSAPGGPARRRARRPRRRAHLGRSRSRAGCRRRRRAPGWPRRWPRRAWGEARLRTRARSAAGRTGQSRLHLLAWRPARCSRLTAHSSVAGINGCGRQRVRASTGAGKSNGCGQIKRVRASTGAGKSNGCGHQRVRASTGAGRRLTRHGVDDARDVDGLALLVGGAQHHALSDVDLRGAFHRQTVHRQTAASTRSAGRAHLGQQKRTRRSFAESGRAPPNRCCEQPPGSAAWRQAGTALATSCASTVARVHTAHAFAWKTSPRRMKPRSPCPAPGRWPSNLRSSLPLLSPTANKPSPFPAPGRCPESRG